ncbi:MAG: hypothetical protein LBJ31_11785 [Treponema sp.]|jgi:hypothetical protein|nr:hypothetical protein [Treponema sp.]
MLIVFLRRRWRFKNNVFKKQCRKIWKTIAGGLMKDKVSKIITIVLIMVISVVSLSAQSGNNEPEELFVDTSVSQEYEYNVTVHYIYLVVTQFNVWQQSGEREYSISAISKSEAIKKAREQWESTKGDNERFSGAEAVKIE